MEEFGLYGDNVIKSKDNPVVKLYQKLASMKKERILYGLFVLEGLRIVQDALKEESHIRHILVTVQAMSKFSDDLSQVDLKDAKLIVISNELGNKIAQTEKTQGIFAICEIPHQKEIVLNENGKYIVLNELQDPGNAGMIIRTADALGIDGIIMCGCCDLYSPKVIRSTMGSVFRMKIWVENDKEKLFNILDKYNILSYASVIDKDAEKINNCDFSKGSAVFIGNEGNGLPEEVSARCNYRITIPMNGNINSLNAAMAAGIIMWELKK